MKKSILFISTGLAIALNSCATNTSNPYGVPSAKVSSGPTGPNPYAVPQSNGETNSYLSQPGVGDSLPPVQRPSAYTPPSTPSPDYTTAVTTNSTPSSHTGSYTVKPGDSLWRISRNNGTTVGAIKAANNMGSDSIKVGQKLRIPNN